MYLQIVEKDPKYAQELKAYLLKMGALLTENEAIIQVPDGFNYNAFHGIEVATSTKPFHEENADVVEWLDKYTGNFSFYLSVRSQLKLKGILSPKQIQSIRNAIKRDKMQPEAAVAQKKTFSLSPGDTVMVSKWLAREAGRLAGLVRPHYTLEVVSVEAETDRAYKATLILSGQRMSRCGICGLTLTDPRSVTAGIGPICAERVGVSFTDGALGELRESLKTTKSINTWFPKAAIKELIRASENGKV